MGQEMEERKKKGRVRGREGYSKRRPKGERAKRRGGEMKERTQRRVSMLITDLVKAM